MTTRNAVQIRAELVDRIIEGLPSTVEVENLSEHGLYFVSSIGLAVGSSVELTLELAPDADGSARTVRLRVRVLRVTKQGEARFGVAAQIMRCQTLHPKREHTGAVKAPVL